MKAKTLALLGTGSDVDQTTLGTRADPWIQITSRNNKPENDTDGAITSNGYIAGSYFHGLFDFPAYRNAFLRNLNPGVISEDQEAAAAFKQKQYDLLAEHFEKNLNMQKLDQIIRNKEN